MAIDFLICCLLLISLAINVLALGAFWVTPGLRTTANRFVINLVIVNIVGCIALAPTLLINTNSSSLVNSVDNNSSNNNNNNNNSITNSSNKLTENFFERTETVLEGSDFANDNNNNNIIINNNNNNNNRGSGVTTTSAQLIDSKVIINATLSTKIECNRTRCQAYIVESDLSGNEIMIAEFSEDKIVRDHTEYIRRDYIKDRMGERYWSLDLAAALGALSVLLVVGDTWCAVTDPLRYHSRISGPKAWVLIAIIWFLGVFFGILSALRDHAFAWYNVPEQTNNDRILTILPNELYNMIFSCLYFIVIILLPFGFVCGMYWRIFSEARENGLRMRQNGSSPLLQSAFNLHKDHHSSSNLIARRSSERDVLKPLLTPVHRPSTQTTMSETKDSDLPDQNDQLDQSDEKKREIVPKSDRNQNILLTLSTASDELRRNHSARQLYLLGSSQDLNNPTFTVGPIRQVQSTPDLQKSMSSNNCPSLGNCNHSDFFTSVHHHQHHLQTSHNQHNGLQLPTVQIPPKALSYMTSIRHRLSNASSLFKYREESRAARISILVVIMFLVSYLPYGLLVLLQGRSTLLLINSKQVAIVMVLLAHLSSPFIFAYRNKRVRRGVRRLFGLETKNGDQLPRKGGFLRRGTKASINVRRSNSKASTYSVSSCKYLTPHVVNNGTFLMEIEKCHYLKKSETIPNKDSNNLLHPPIDPATFISIKQHSNNNENSKIIKSLLIQDRRSILKRVCDSSRKLGCATNSCTTSDNEQTDV